MKRKLTAFMLALLLCTAAVLPVAAELLRYGDTGPRVGVLQLKLQGLGYYLGALDNKYGYQLYKAVRNYQIDNALKVDGIAGPETLASLGILPPPPGTPPTGLPLSKGSTGTKVKDVQTRLKTIGYYYAVPNSVFDDYTKNAVIGFQKNNGLPSDGVVGNTTWSRLFSNGAYGKVPLEPTCVLRLKLNDQYPAVLTLQNHLTTLKYYTKGVSGVYDYYTYECVRKFQKKNSLKADGVVGAITWNKLTDPGAVPADAAPPPPPGAPFLLKYGDTGADVLMLQKELKLLKYYSGPEDGVFSYSVVEAVRKFQKKNGLKADGVVGILTWNAVFAPGAIPADAVPAPPPGAPMRIKYQDVGPQVLQIQQRLQVLLYYKGAMDGTFNYTLYQSVRKFQRYNGLKVDGVVGQKTWDKMMDAGAVPNPKP